MSFDTTAVTDNPATPLAADPTQITVIDEAAIPTLTAGAQMLTLLLASLGLVMLRRDD